MDAGPDGQRACAMQGGRAAVPEPLEGIKVVELARALRGPAAGQYLADMGADVIKVEPALGSLCLRSTMRSRSQTVNIGGRRWCSGPTSTSSK